MNKLIEELGVLMNHISTDTKRTKLIEFTMKLVELSVILAESKKEIVRLKWRYEREEVTRKEQCKMFLEKEAMDKYQKELETADEKDRKKVKKDKVTNIEASDLCKLELLWFQDEGEFLVHKLDSAQQTVAYLDPILKSYIEFLNWVKFTDNINKSLSVN